MADDPKFDHKRLVKFLGMTTSTNDGEALSAIRMANRELARLGKTWQEFVDMRITVVEDPFGNLPEPGRPGRQPPPRPAPQAPPRPAWYDVTKRLTDEANNIAINAGSYGSIVDMIRELRARTGASLSEAKPAMEAALLRNQPKAKPDPWASTQGAPAAVISNKFAGLCKTCGERVGENEGEAFVDGKKANGQPQWRVRHLPGKCPTKAKPAPQRPSSLNDLDDLFN